MQPGWICATAALTGPGDHDCSFQIQVDTFTQPDALLHNFPKPFFGVGLETSVPRLLIQVLLNNNRKALNGVMGQGIPISHKLHLHSRVLQNSLRRARSKDSLPAWGQKETSSKGHAIIYSSCIFC